MSYAAEDEKRLLAHAAETTTQLADTQTRRHCSRGSACSPACKRRIANVKRVFAFAATLFFVVACSVMALGLSSLAVGTMRHVAPSCSKHGAAHSPAKVHAPGAAPANANAEVAGPVVVADAAVPTTPASSFSRLIEAVSPDTLHDLLHEYFPEMYKHGVYPSEQSALEVIHRKNAALATSIAQLARRDLNSTGSASSPAVSSTPSSVLPSSSVPVTSAAASNASASSAPAASSAAPSTKASSASGITTASAHTTKSTAAATFASSKKVTSVFTSTINGTPTVVTATSVVGVAATNSAATSTATGSLQTGAAMPMLSGANAQLAKAVAGVVVGAMFI